MTPHDKRLAEIRQRAEHGTPGPWKFNEESIGPMPIWADVVNTAGREVRQVVATAGATYNHLDVTVYGEQNQREVADARFIANSREDIPYLLSRIDALTRALEGLVYTHGEPCADQKRGLGDCEAVRLGKQALSPAPGDGNEEVIFDRDRSGKVTYDHGADERYREQRDGKE